MATKAELEAELAILKQKLADRPALEDRKRTTNSGDTGGSQDRGSRDALLPDLEKILSDHGYDAPDIEALWDQLSKEVKDLTDNKPLMTVVVAFVLGYLLGRSR